MWPQWLGIGFKGVLYSLLITLGFGEWYPSFITSFFLEQTDWYFSFFYLKALLFCLACYSSLTLIEAIEDGKANLWSFGENEGHPTIGYHIRLCQLWRFYIYPILAQPILSFFGTLKMVKNIGMTWRRWSTRRLKEFQKNLLKTKCIISWDRQRRRSMILFEN